MQKLPSRYAPFKSNREVEPAEYDHNEFNRDKSAANKIARSGNKRGRGSNDQGRGKKLSKRMRNSKRDTGRRNVKVPMNLSQKLKQQGRGTQVQGGGRGRRTVRKRRVEKRAVEDLLLGHAAAASRSSKCGKEPLRSLDEEWDGERASPMTPVHIGIADISNSVEEVESDDNGQAVEYDQGNWEIGYNGVSPNRWSRGLGGMSDDDVDAFEDDNDNDNGIEENEVEDSEADAMSGGSDDMANRVVDVGGSDSAVSEDSSDSNIHF